MALSIADLVNNAEAAIRAGQGLRVAKELQLIPPRSVPRSLRLPAANLCRRVGLFSSGIKMLAPVVRAEGKRLESGATAMELAEYAALLERLGVIPEALRILSRIKTSTAPSARLFEAFCHFARWEYEKSVPLLREYLSQDLPVYDSLVGNVNLASALLGIGQLEEATEILNENLAEISRRGFSRLHGNCLEMRAQARFLMNQYDLATNDLNDAADLLRADGTCYQPYIQKWHAIITAFETGDSGLLNQFRLESLKRGDWESVRDSDRHLVSLNPDPNRSEHLIFGTPFRRYRERIMKTFDKYDWPPYYEFGQKGAAFIDLASGAMAKRQAFKEGSKTHQVLAALLADFYRPTSVGDLFSNLFPGEYFDVYSSPNRIRQAICRVRDWIKEAGIPVAIETEYGGYRLVCNGPFAFRVGIDREPINWNQLQLQKIYELFGSDGGFSSRSGRELLGLNLTAYKRLMGWALENRYLERRGATNSTYYSLRIEFDRRTG